MRDPYFHEQVLGLQAPWRVDDVQVDKKAKTVETFVVYDGPVHCPLCNEVGRRYDHRERRWRHLNLYEYQAYVVARVPRVECSEHGVHQLSVAWAESNSAFTALFECLAIALLKDMSISAAAKMLGLSWKEVDTIMRRAVARGLQRRQRRPLRHIGIDEKSVKKRHVYFTIVTDLDRDEVIWIGRGRKRETLDMFWKTLSSEERSGIVGIAMDMHDPYVQSTLSYVLDAAKKIVFDKFHVTMQLSKAVDETRRAMMRDGVEDAPGLKKTRYLWLYAQTKLTDEQQTQLDDLRWRYIRLGIAWSQKENFAEFWKARTIMAAREFFANWAQAVRETFNEPMIAAMRTLERHLDNIVTYIQIPITNAGSEGMNSRIQSIKFRAC
jgi:transposase